MMGGFDEIRAKAFDPVPGTPEKLFIWLGGAVRAKLRVEIDYLEPGAVRLALVRENSRWERIETWDGNWAGALVTAMLDLIRMLPADERQEIQEAESLPPGAKLRAER